MIFRSEDESASIPREERKHWRRFWLIDPIDGTKEVTLRPGEFTVNIALIENGELVLGVVTVPALREAFWGAKGEGDHKRDRTGKVTLIRTEELGESKRVVASKNHLNGATRKFIQKLGEHELVQAGSALKFCRFTEGGADIYPRLGPICEWDTAAAHAILVAAGGKVETMQGKPLTYGKENLQNPYLVAAAK